MIFPVRYQNQGFGFFILSAKRFNGGIDGVADGGSLYGNQFCVNGGKKYSGGTIIKSQRTLDEGGSGKGDESDSVPVHHIKKIGDFSFGPLKPIGFDVFCQHAVGNIQRNDDIDPALM